jgi:hypothetical protein
MPTFEATIKIVVTADSTDEAQDAVREYFMENPVPDAELVTLED